MKILGKTRLAKRTRDVVVGTDPDTGEAVKLTLRAPRFSEIERVEAEIPAPLAPVVKGDVRRDRKGRPLKDSSGKAIPFRDETDPAHLAALLRREKAQGCALLLICADGQIEARERVASEGPTDYYINLLDEFHDAGIDMGVMLNIHAAISTLMTPLTISELKQSREALGRPMDEKEEAIIKQEQDKPGGAEGNGVAPPSSGSS